MNRARLEAAPRPEHEHPAKHFKRSYLAIPDVIWVPFSCAFLMLIPGVLSLLLREPWLFPSLAPTALLLTATPRLPSAKLYNSLAGHLLAIGTGLLMAVVFQLAGHPPVLVAGKIDPPRIWATIVGMAVLPFLQILLRAINPPAAATLLLITLGAFKPHWGEIRYLVLGILVTVFAGEILRRVRLAQPGQS
ncbi:MAG: HPP family protein [Deltaproteobacteria bacterium]|nr:HPP family protein [Deltaproteobacteria bacterium]